jgi:hypothetical protein
MSSFGVACILLAQGLVVVAVIATLCGRGLRARMFRDSGATGANIDIEPEEQRQEEASNDS